MKRAAPSADDNQDADDELRTYAQMLLTSAPVLIDAQLPRAFLETAQRLAAQLFRALRDTADQLGAPARLDDSLAQLRAAAAPLLAILSPEQRAAVSSVGVGSSEG